MNEQDFNEFLASYRQGLVWCSADDEDQDFWDDAVATLGGKITYGDREHLVPSGAKATDYFDDDFFIPTLIDCGMFLAVASSLIDASRHTYTQAGHDFAMTRQETGCGFWDGDWGEVLGDALTEKCVLFPSLDLYVADDGIICY